MAAKRYPTERVDEEVQAETRALGEKGKLRPGPVPVWVTEIADRYATRTATHIGKRTLPRTMLTMIVLAVAIFIAFSVPVEDGGKFWPVLGGISLAYLLLVTYFRTVGRLSEWETDEYRTKEKVKIFRAHAAEVYQTEGAKYTGNWGHDWVNTESVLVNLSESGFISDEGNFDDYMLRYLGGGIAAVVRNFSIDGVSPDVMTRQSEYLNSLTYALADELLQLLSDESVADLVKSLPLKESRTDVRNSSKAIEYIQERLTWGIESLDEGTLDRGLSITDDQYAALPQSFIEKGAQIRDKEMERFFAEVDRRNRARMDLELWQQDHPAPPASPYDISPRGAEFWVRDWMTHMGLEEAEVTQASGDGGIDVIAEGAVAQVKLYTSPIPVADVREFAGVALTNHRSEIPLFFCLQ